MSLIQRSALRRLPKPSVTIAHPTRRTFVGATWGALVNTVADGICAVHHVGLPWYMTIPLVAATVNFTVRLPVQYYARQTRNKYAQAMPVVQAWERVRVHKAMRKIDPSSPDAQKQSTLALSRAKADNAPTRRRIFRAVGCQTWKHFIPPVTVVPFIMFSDALRRISGVQLSASSDVSRFDSSLSDGGLAWFTDLSAADPYYALPVACVAALGSSTWRNRDVWNVFLSRDIEAPTLRKGWSGLQPAFQRLLLLVPFWPLFAGLNMPSSILLYWVSSFSLTHVNNWIMDRYIPKPEQPLQPIKRTELSSPFIHASTMDRTLQSASTSQNPK
ncbi:mitochondrial export translocase Oxa2 [Emericellopsis atlantica]|uniref:Mitochondrial export translocase Oxa2 n=1 Tax=Emericellopsis atlantica TaxID=2614577 RepID=A0A9P7ZTV9_9HYPO|nr:mitochondrial export translocase Oxa2 [Emericellopsis atlantica]KAG9257585.1 mitochondrial export translocase Oxa2 [Emericellopsis atlantica]